MYDKVKNDSKNSVIRKTILERGQAVYLASLELRDNRQTAQ